ncbi:zinc finger BED domain-containing protein 5-like [Diabrotica undecimpunctata]|uniref:zinc finger BED domain-containing protein 5-like n=1 Tax=Diabrotica undecimpunctata TaxID=50387 RepID=UPI003B63F6BA
MCPGRLEWHLITNHSALKDKGPEFFIAKKSSLKRMKLDSAANFRVKNEKAVEASYKIALLIVKDKKPHTIGESLIKPCLLTACSTVLSEDSCKKVEKISLSNDTITRRIDNMALSLKNQLLQKLKGSPSFSLQCDETTDISKHAQLLFYCRFIDRKRFLEEILFSTSLETTTKAIDIFSALEDFLIINELPWEKLIGICNDGAQAMTGCRSGFIEFAKKKNPRIIGSHCIIHRQALASRTLPEPHVTLNLAIKIVNHIKSSALNTRLFQVLCQELNSDQETLLFHTEVRWLSKGNMLVRLFNLKSEVELLLMTSKQEDLNRRFTDDKNVFYLAYLSDFYETLNVLNLKL